MRARGHPSPGLVPARSPRHPGGGPRAELAVAVLLVVLGALVSAGCVEDPGAPAPASAPPAATVVILGGAAAFGDGVEDPLRDAWDQRLVIEHLPAGTAVVNLARIEAPTAEAVVVTEVPELASVEADVAVIWLDDPAGVEQVVDAVSPDVARTLVVQRTAAPVPDGVETVVVGDYDRSDPAEHDRVAAAVAAAVAVR